MLSAACYFYAMAAILGVKSIVKGIHKDSMQGDIKFIYALERIGCVITDKPEGLEVNGTSAVGYEGIDIDMSDFSDRRLQWLLWQLLERLRQESEILVI